MFFIKIYIKESYINYYDTSIQMCGQYCILAPDNLFLTTLYNRGCWAINKNSHTVNNVYYFNILFIGYNNA